MPLLSKHTWNPIKPDLCGTAGVASPLFCSKCVCVSCWNPQTQQPWLLRHSNDLAGEKWCWASIDNNHFRHHQYDSWGMRNGLTTLNFSNLLLGVPETELSKPFSCVGENYFYKRISFFYHTFSQRSNQCTMSNSAAMFTSKNVVPNPSWSRGYFNNNNWRKNIEPWRTW